MGPLYCELKNVRRRAKFLCCNFCYWNWMPLKEKLRWSFLTIHDLVFSFSHLVQTALLLFFGPDSVKRSLTTTCAQDLYITRCLWIYFCGVRISVCSITTKKSVKNGPASFFLATIFFLVIETRCRHQFYGSNYDFGSIYMQMLAPN